MKAFMIGGTGPTGPTGPHIIAGLLARGYNVAMRSPDQGQVPIVFRSLLRPITGFSISSVKG